MFSSMAQPQGRRGNGRSRSVSRTPMQYDRADTMANGRSKQPYHGAPQSVHRSSSNGNLNGQLPRRRSLNGQRQLAYQIQGSSQQQQQQQQHFARSFPSPVGPDGSSDTGSATSARSSRHSHDFRDPQNTKSNSKHSTLYRDESPLQGRKVAFDTPQKYIKIVRKLIDGKTIWILGCLNLQSKASN